MTIGQDLDAVLNSQILADSRLSDRCATISAEISAVSVEVSDLARRLTALEKLHESPPPEPEPEPEPPPQPALLTTIDPLTLAYRGSAGLPNSLKDPAEQYHSMGYSSLTACLEGDDMWIGGHGYTDSLIRCRLPLDRLVQGKDAKAYPLCTYNTTWVRQNAEVLAIYNQPTFYGMDRYDDLHTVNVLKTYYMVSGGKGSPTIHLHSKTGLQPAHGPWYLGDWAENSTGGNVCEIHRDVRAMLGGYTHGAACAFSCGNAANSWGPGLIAFTPDKAVPRGGSLPCSTLLFYPHANRMQVGNTSDNGLILSASYQNGMGFLRHGNRVAFVAGFGLGQGQIHYKGTKPSGREMGGSWADSYRSVIFFYDVADLARVSRSELRSWEVMPYATLDVSPYLVGFDPVSEPQWKLCVQNNRLVIVQGAVMRHLSDYEAPPAVHVFEIQ